MKTILAYIAGVVDGEGSIIIREYRSKRPYRYGTEVSVAMTDTGAIDLLRQIYPGSYSTSTLKSGKTIYRWAVAHRKARAFLEDIYEYLRVKKEQARLAIELESRKITTRYPHSVSLDEINIRKDIRRQVQVLNKSRFLKSV